MRADAATITIAWDPNTEADLAGYLVAYGSVPGRDDVVVDVGLTTTWTMTTAVAGSTYYLRVYAYNFAGLRSAASTEVFATPTNTSPPNGVFSTDRTAVTFGAVRSGSTITQQTPAQTVLVSQVITNPAPWSATVNRSWLRLSRSSGTGTGTFAISIAPSSLAVGAYTGTVTVTMSGVSVPITVTTRVYSVGTTGAPVGVFDTPSDGITNVMGALPVTGWVLDDVAVSRVDVYRDPVAGEGGLVFIGQGTFVAGSRPDVETIYAGTPLNYRAGWGLQILTNMLPDQLTGGRYGGNGNFRLHAYATDLEGHQSYLGAKRFAANNRNATKPFGTIDTPSQGGTVSGTFTNFGWALSPSGTIPTNGSTISVIIDGVVVGRPVYNQYRSDIANSFPGYANTNGAVGYYTFDSTRLSNGMHTMSWVVTDNRGNAEGIGSRFFTVMNGATAAMTSAVESSTTTTSSTTGDMTGQSTTVVAEVPTENNIVEVQRAAAPQEAPQIVMPEWSGEVQLNSVETEQIEVRLANQFTDDWGGTYEGYLVVDGQMRPLPIGSALDKDRGVFMWQPGPGFLGKYEFVFLRSIPGGSRTKIPVRLEIAPKFDRERRDRDK